jgi:hypothetical protein
LRSEHAPDYFRHIFQLTPGPKRCLNMQQGR